MHGLNLDTYYSPQSLGMSSTGGKYGMGGRGGPSGPLPNQSRTNVYIGNLPETITEAKLDEIFKRYGNVVSVKVRVCSAEGKNYLNF